MPRKPRRTSRKESTSALFDAQAAPPKPDGGGSPAPLTTTGSTGWDAALTRRLKVLLHTGPLHEPRRGDSLRDDALRHYDSLTLAIRVLDLVVSSMGREREVDRAEFDRVLGGAPQRRRPAAPVSCHVHGLRGGGGGRRAELRVPPPRRPPHPSERTVLSLSNEAVNLFLSALELDIEDAQAAILAEGRRIPEEVLGPAEMAAALGLAS